MWRLNVLYSIQYNTAKYYQAQYFKQKYKDKAWSTSETGNAYSLLV